MGHNIEGIFCGPLKDHRVSANGALMSRSLGTFRGSLGTLTYCCNPKAGPALFAVSMPPQSQSRYCWWYRSSHGTDSDISEIAALQR